MMDGFGREEKSILSYQLVIHSGEFLATGF